MQQSRFAHSGFADDVNDAKLAARRLQITLQHVELALAPDVRRKAALCGGGKAGRIGPKPGELEDFERLCFSLQLVFASWLYLNLAFHESSVASLRHTVPGSANDCSRAAIYINSVAHGSDAAVLHLADHRQSGAKADAQLRVSAELLLKMVRRPPEAIHNAERGPASLQRRVFVGDRGAENRHQSVAREALERAALLAYHLAGQLRHVLHQPKGGFLAGSLGKGGETHHVREQDRDLTTLRLQGRSPRGWTRRIVQPHWASASGTQSFRRTGAGASYRSAYGRFLALTARTEPILRRTRAPGIWEGLERVE